MTMADRFPSLVDARRMADLGFRPLWLSPYWSGGSGAGKHPVADNWSSLPWVVPVKVQDAPGPGCNLGILTGAVNGAPSQVIAINCDTVVAVDDVVSICGQTSLRVVTQRGEALLYRRPDGASVPRGSVLRGVAGVSVLGDGCQIAVAPSIHRSGSVYHEPEPWTPLLISSAPLFPLTALDVEVRVAALDAVREVVRLVPDTEATAVWLGCFVQSHCPACVSVVRGAVSPRVAPAFGAGVAVADSGSSVNRPGEVEQSVPGLLRAAMRGTETPDGEDPELTLDYSVGHIVHREMPVGEDATFEITLTQGSETIVVFGTGPEIAGYRYIHGKAINCGVKLPTPNQTTSANWSKRLGAALKTREVRQEVSGRTAGGSIREILLAVLRDGQEADTSKKFKSGGVFRGEYKCGLYPEAAISLARSRLPDDRIQREDVVRAMRSLGGGDGGRAHFKDGQPSAWMFPNSVLD